MNPYLRHEIVECGPVDVNEKPRKVRRIHSITIFDLLLLATIFIVFAFILTLFVVLIKFNHNNI